MIITKNFDDLKEYSLCHPKLLELLQFAHDFMYTLKSVNMCVTEIRRTEREQRALYPDNPDRISLHTLYPVQAIDIRSWEYSKEDIAALEIAINNSWDFNYKDQKCIIYHKLSTGAYHLHLQATDLTNPVRNYING